MVRVLIGVGLVMVLSVVVMAGDSTATATVNRDTVDLMAGMRHVAGREGRYKVFTGMLGLIGGTVCTVVGFTQANDAPGPAMGMVFGGGFGMMVSGVRMSIGGDMLRLHRGQRVRRQARPVRPVGGWYRRE